MTSIQNQSVKSKLTWICLHSYYREFRKTSQKPSEYSLLKHRDHTGLHNVGGNLVAWRSLRMPLLLYTEGHRCQDEIAALNVHLRGLQRAHLREKHRWMLEQYMITLVNGGSASARRKYPGCKHSIVVGTQTAAEPSTNRLLRRTTDLLFLYTPNVHSRPRG